MFCQGHDSAPGLDIMLLKQQHLSVSGQAADPARQHPPVEYVYRRSHPLLQFSSPEIGNATSTIPHKYSGRQLDAFECGCADGAGPTTRRGSHVYEINTWLWNFGRPQPRVGGLSVAKTEKIQRKSRSEASKRGWADGQLSGLASDLRLVYVWYIHGIYLVYPWYILSDSKSCLLSAIK